MIAQFVEAPEVLKDITVVPDEIIEQCHVQGRTFEIPDANREHLKSGVNANIDLGRPFRVQPSWWEKVIEMWFGIFRM
jgi:hypothetical protein